MLNKSSSDFREYRLCEMHSLGALMKFLYFLRYSPDVDKVWYGIYLEIY